MKIAVITLLVLGLSVFESRADPETPCVPKLRICPANLSPACGSNGVSYSNECALEAAKDCDPGLTKASDWCCEGDTNLCDSMMVS